MFLSACKNEPQQRYSNKRNNTKFQEFTYAGKTMGTYYSIKYLAHKEVVDLTLIEYELMLINNSLSTYIDDSKISKLNKATKNEKVFVDDWMIGCLSKSVEINENTAGAFDPSIAPIVNYWGFGKIKDAPKAIDSIKIDSLLNYKGLNQFKTGVNPKAGNNDEKLFITKTHSNAQLDFSALAKGMGVDIIYNKIMEKGVENLLVDIGGELRALGVNKNGEVWQVGIDKPLNDKNDERELKAIIPIENRAIATSGNYRNYQMVNNQKMGHIINPDTGFPELSDLLSVSVLASDCMTADAYATAFMVMGWERAGILVENTPQMEAYFIVSEGDGQLKTMISSGLKGVIKE